MTDISGPLCAFFASVVWAIASSHYTKMSETEAPTAINLCRAITGTLTIGCLGFYLAGGLTPWLQAVGDISTRHLFYYLLAMIVTYALGDALFFQSAAKVGVPVALAIGNTFPVWTVLFGVWAFDAAFSMTIGLGMMVAVGGIVVLTLLPKKGVSGKRAKRLPASSYILPFFVSLAWATNMIALAQGGKGVSPFVGNPIRLAMGFILIPFVHLFLGQGRSLWVSLPTLKKYGWVFFLEAFVGSNLILYGLAHSPLALGTALASLAPVLSVPLEIALGRESFDFKKFLAILIVLLGVMLIIFGSS